MCKIIIVLCFLFSAPSYGSVFLGAGASGRLVQNDEKNYEARFPLLLYGGYERLPWAYALEMSYMDNGSSTSGMYSISSEQYDLSAYVMRFINYEDARTLNPYVIGGAGVLQTVVKTEFGSSVDTDKSDYRMALKAGAGIWAQLGIRGFLNLEGKVLYSNAYSPDIVFEVSTRAGFIF